MAQKIRADICVIGAGAGGLAVAAGAAQMGARTVLVERREMGGSHLNTGCVPSKALLAAARRANAMGASEAFGLARAKPRADFECVHEHVRGVVAALAPNDSVARFEGLGVTVVRDHARFRDARSLVAGRREIRARRFVIATGSRPVVPPIPGLDTVPFLTGETIFANRTRPDHLIVIGGGPAGMELAQAHRRLGAKVTILEAARVLAKEDPELSAFVADRLVREGVDIREGVKVVKVAGEAGRIAVTVEAGGTTRDIAGTHLLVATGREPVIDGLDLDKAGIETDAHGIRVDDRLRTRNRRVFAIGDAVGDMPFTHVASHHAEIVLRNALFRLPARVDYGAIPRVIYTDPELAHVGETEAGARARNMKINVLRWHLAENDRAQAERETDGGIKIVTDMHSRILGCTVVGPHAGELILPWVLAKSQALKLSAMARIVAPYPTLSEISKRAASSYYMPTLYGAKTRAIVRFLGLFG